MAKIHAIPQKLLEILTFSYRHATSDQIQAIFPFFMPPVDILRNIILRRADQISSKGVIKNNQKILFKTFILKKILLKTFFLNRIINHYLV